MTEIPLSQKDESILIKLLERHFKEDDDNFHEIKEKQSKTDELLQINGEHMSYIRRDLTEVKQILIKQNEVQEKQSQRLNDHIKAVEPILQRYQDEEAGKRLAERFGKPVIKTVIGGATIITAWYVIKDFFHLK